MPHPAGTILRRGGAVWIVWDSGIALPVLAQPGERHRADVSVSDLRDRMRLGGRSVVRIADARPEPLEAEIGGRVSDALLDLLAAAVEAERRQLGVEAKWARGYTDRAVRF